MTTIPLPSLVDAIRWIDLPFERIVLEYLAHFNKPPPQSGYDHSRQSVRPIFNGEWPADDADRLVMGVPKPNDQIMPALFRAAEERREFNRKPLFCFPVEERIFGIRPDVLFRINPSVGYFLNKRSYVIWIQPRIYENPPINDLRIIASILFYLYISNNSDIDDIEILDFSRKDVRGSRVCSAYYLSDFSILSESSIVEKFSTFLSARDYINSEGLYQPYKRRPKENPLQGQFSF